MHAKPRTIALHLVEEIDLITPWPKDESIVVNKCPDEPKLKIVSGQRKIQVARQNGELFVQGTIRIVRPVVIEHIIAQDLSPPDSASLAKLKAILLEGWDLTPIILYKNSKMYRLVDGRIRLSAYVAVGRTTIPGVLIERPHDAPVAEPRSKPRSAQTR